MKEEKVNWFNYWLSVLVVILLIIIVFAFIQYINFEGGRCISNPSQYFADIFQEETGHPLNCMCTTDYPTNPLSFTSKNG